METTGELGTMGERGTTGAARASELFWTAPPGALPRGARFVMTTRRGGVSEGPTASLNLGFGVGDREASVRENVRRVREGLGLLAEEPRRVRQVHGTAVVSADAAGSEADGFLLRGGDPWASVTVADCAPVALVAEGAAWGALLHSGWRGTRDGIAVRAVELLARRGIAPETLHAIVGPCIHACCYPVGADVARRFPVSLVVPRPDGTFALDLPGAIAAALAGAGVSPERITIAIECTASFPERFYSHRRDRGATGRHWALLRLDPASR